MQNLYGWVAPKAEKWYVLFFKMYDVFEKELMYEEEERCMQKNCFDSISHDYIYESLNFFNFGDYFIKIEEQC